MANQHQEVNGAIRRAQCHGGRARKHGHLKSLYESLESACPEEPDLSILMEGVKNRTSADAQARLSGPQTPSTRSTESYALNA